MQFKYANSERRYAKISLSFFIDREDLISGALYAIDQQSDQRADRADDVLPLVNRLDRQRVQQGVRDMLSTYGAAVQEIGIQYYLTFLPGYVVDELRDEVGEVIDRLYPQAGAEV